MPVSAMSPIQNLVDAPPFCPECSAKMRAVPIQAVKGKIRGFILSCDHCKYSKETPVTYINAQDVRYHPKAEVEVKS